MQNIDNVNAPNQPKVATWQDYKKSQITMNQQSVHSFFPQDGSRSFDPQGIGSLGPPPSAYDAAMNNAILKLKF